MGGSAQAIGVTERGRNSKIHSLLDKYCPPVGPIDDPPQQRLRQRATARLVRRIPPLASVRDTQCRALLRVSPKPRWSAFATSREPGFAVGQLADLAAVRNSEGVVP